MVHHPATLIRNKDERSLLLNLFSILPIMAS